jgi:excinuclease UvrABC nuclease subunit
MDKVLIESKRIPLKKIAGCYLLWKDDEIIYVGQSVNIIARIGVHSEHKEFDEYSYFELEHPTKDELNELEAALIIKYAPSLNQALPHNKRYASLVGLRSRDKIPLRVAKRAIKANGLIPIFRDYYDKDELIKAGLVL